MVILDFPLPDQIWKNGPVELPEEYMCTFLFS